MTGGSHRRIFRAARIVAVCRAHPLLVLVVAVLALAAAGATGYLVHARRPMPEAVAAAGGPIIQPVLAASDAKVHDTVYWRDDAGAIYRAKIGDGRLDEFLRQRKDTLEAARSASREWAAAQVLAELKPIFGDMQVRIKGYAEWYFDYLTKYELMAHALVPAFEYLGHVLDFSTPLDKSLVEAIGPHVVAYLNQQYTKRVVQPFETGIRLQSAYDKTYATLRARWESIVDEQQAAMAALIREQAGSAERVSPDQTAEIPPDLDRVGNRGADVHQEALVDESFRRGSLEITLRLPKVAGSPPESAPSASSDKGKYSAEDSDEITHVIVNLFDRLIGPVVTQMADLAIGVFAGGAAGGTTAGFGMAGGFAMTGAPAAFATGVTTAVPIGAAIGLVATVAAEMLSNRLEASLNRGEFEENLRKNIDATENAIESGIISALNQHVEAWYGNVVDRVAVK